MIESEVVATMKKLAVNSGPCRSGKSISMAAGKNHWNWSVTKIEMRAS
jgi:hypothetical protein